MSGLFISGSVLKVVKTKGVFVPVVYLKSGGTAVCGGYTVKEGVVQMVDVTFCTRPFFRLLPV